MKEPEQVGQINPESTVQATGVETAIHERVVPLDHHKTFAFQAVHRPVVPLSTGLSGRIVPFQTDTNVSMLFSGDD
ncbi:MAG: hypothetical protein KIT49_05995 [Nitrospira sp.]|jgi:hypothetical protein|nr:hypothetical protein [Nitrospira sp.]MDR4471822.1 hypothetical protein [Nitrospira sp.]